MRRTKRRLRRVSSLRFRSAVLAALLLCALPSAAMGPCWIVVQECVGFVGTTVDHPIYGTYCSGDADGCYVCYCICNPPDGQPFVCD